MKELQFSRSSAGTQVTFELESFVDVYSSRWLAVVKRLKKEHKIEGTYVGTDVGTDVKEINGHISVQVSYKV